MIKKINYIALKSDLFSMFDHSNMQEFRTVLAQKLSPKKCIDQRCSANPLSFMFEQNIHEHLDDDDVSMEFDAGGSFKLLTKPT